ncbi:MAG: hypothetical protein HRU29_16160 [Rhizobiales bacterium]|nr:hypothetical protein [Hyphomicrobiales bacterium]NRB15928.1 hypothetical protein [Hyphomicrobiales bacterium]
MSDNLKLVNFIIKELIKNNSHKLEFIASVDFAYYLNSEPKQNFAQLAKRAAMVQWNTILITSKVTSTDDTHFYQDFEIQIPTDNRENSMVYGHTEFVVIRGLLSKVTIKHFLSKQDFDEFNNRLKASSVALL